MKIKSFLVNTFASATLLAFSFCASSAVLTFESTLDTDENNFPLVEFYSFSVDIAGEVTFNVLASGAGIDIGNGTSTLDAYIIVAQDDGDRTADDIFGSNDDGGPGTDSLLTLNLEIGDYIAGVSSCCVSTSEFISGVNSSLVIDVLGGPIPDYRLTIEGDVSNDVVVTPTPVSSPSIIALFSLGVICLFNRKRFSK